MNVVDIVEIVIAAVAIIVSVIGLIQSRKANKLSNGANELSSKANNIAEHALRDSQKECMPLIRFVGKVDFGLKSIDKLRNENTFDFYKKLIRIEKRDGFFYDVDDEFPCVTAEIENCGNGIIKGITLNRLWIKEGNKVAINYE